MAQPTLATIRGWVQGLVVDTGSYLGNTYYTDFINHAICQYAEIYPDTIALNGLIVGSTSISVGNKSVTVAFSSPPPILRNITGAFLTGKGALERAEVLDILRKQVSETTQGQPTQYAIYGNSPGTGSGSLTYKVLLWPIADASYTLDLYGSCQPPMLSGDSDYTNFMDAECHVIARMAALDAARALGRDPDFAQGIAAGLPDAVKAHLGVQVRDTQPRQYAGKSVV